MSGRARRKIGAIARVPSPRGRESAAHAPSPRHRRRCRQRGRDVPSVSPSATTPTSCSSTSSTACRRARRSTSSRPRPVVGYRLHGHRHQRLRRHGRQRRRRHHVGHPAQAGHEPRRPAGHERGDRRRSCRRAPTRSPDAIVIIVTNPLDAMCHVAYDAPASRAERVIGMAGVLDSARFRTFLARSSVSVSTRTSRLRAGRPRRHDGAVASLLDRRRHSHHRADDAGAGRQRSSSGRATAVPRSSACSRRAAPTTPRRQRWRRWSTRSSTTTSEVLPCAAYLRGEYGFEGLFVGVPVKLGRGGVEQIVEIELQDDERAAFDQSAAADARTCRRHGQDRGPVGARRHDLRQFGALGLPVGRRLARGWTRSSWIGRSLPRSPSGPASRNRSSSRMTSACPASGSASPRRWAAAHRTWARRRRWRTCRRR